MDPLSLAASIAGLLSLTASVISAGYTLCSKLSKNASDLPALISETAGFSGVLLAVKTHMESQPQSVPDPEVMTRMLGACRNTVIEISGMLDKLSKANRISMIVKGEEREERLEKLLRRVEQHKSFFILCFQLEHSSQSTSTQRKMEEILEALTSLSQSQKRIETTVDSLTDIEKLKHLDEVIRVFGAPTIAEHADLCKLRDPDTAQWVLSRPEFGMWLSSERSSFFWLNGTQGSGKSIITSKVIETIQETSLNPGTSAMAYHYCRFSNPTSLSPSMLVGSFVGQLLRQLEFLIPEPLLGRVDKLYRGHKRKSTLLTLEELREVFVETSRCFEKLFLVIDGLDEMPLDGRWCILDFLGNIAEGDDEIKVFVSSRAEMDLESAFSFYCTVAITPSDVAPDIERFVRRKLASSRFHTSQIEEVVRELVSRADGMFLWAFCQLENLLQVRTAITPRLLTELPRSLERTFEQTFLKLGEHDRHHAKRILQFVMFSGAPLDPSELVEGIAVTFDTKSLKEVGRDKLQQWRDVFEICGSLIRESQSTGKIELAHFSVYEFLKSSKLEGNRVNDFNLKKADADLELLTACVLYLSMDDVCRAELPLQFGEAPGIGDSQISAGVLENTQFLEHATTNWTIYISRLSREKLRDIWSPVLLPFFQPNAKRFQFWTAISRYIYGKYKYPLEMTPLHAAALHGLKDVAEMLLEDPALQSAPWRHPDITVGSRTPLHIAIENGNDDMIGILATPNYLRSTDETGRDPLQVAIETGSRKAVLDLVTQGANVNSPGPDGRTPLFMAIENKWEGISSLSESADPATRMLDGRGLLHAAAQVGSTVWTASLLEFHHDALMNAVDQEGWTPLHYAADGGHTAVAKILLSKNAFVGMEDRNGWTPLHAALRHKHHDCARELLNSNNAKRPSANQFVVIADYDDSTPEGRRSIMDHKYGSRPPDDTPAGAPGSSNQAAQSSDGPAPPGSDHTSGVHSPLLLAVSNDDIVGLELLLTHGGAYGREELGFGETAGSYLEEAISRGNMKILEMLLPVSHELIILKAVAAVSWHRDEEVLAIFRKKLDAKFVHTRILPHAISDGSGSVLVVEFLLDIWPPSAETLPENILHTTALLTTKQSCHIAGLLVSAGADLVSQNRDGHTPLQAAIVASNWDMAEVLITKGIMGIEERLSALHTTVVSARFHEDPRRKALHIANMLLECGVDIDGGDDLGRSICHKAAARTDSMFLRWALDNDAYPAMVDTAGDTAVQVAISFQRTENLKVLLNQIVQAVPEELVRVFTSSGKRRPPLLIATDTANIFALTQLLEADRLAVAGLTDDDLTRQGLRSKVFTEALCNAIQREFEDGAKILIAAMRRIPEVFSTGQVPLRYAVRLGKVKFVRMLLDNGATDVGSDSGETLYSIAAKGEMSDVMGVLLEYDAGYQPGDLVAAARKGDMTLANRVLAKYPNDLEGQRKALFTARKCKKPAIQELLLARARSRPAQVRPGDVPRDAFGDTALHRAVREKNAGAVRRMSGSCDTALLKARDVDGDSALMLAIRNCLWLIADILAGAGADIGEALEWARTEDCYLWIEKLEELSRRYA